MQPSEILPSSTGIIGHLLPMEKVERGIVEAGMNLGGSAEHALRFGDAIMTTDTRRKTAAVQLRSAATSSRSPASAKAPA